MTAHQPVRPQTVRVEKGQLRIASGIFPVSRIDGTRLMDRWHRPAGAGYLALVVGLFFLGVAVVFALAGFAIREADFPWISDSFVWENLIFVVGCLALAIVFFVVQVKAQPKTSYWHELEIWIGGTRQVVAAWHLDPLRAIQREIAAAQRDLEYTGQPISIGQVNQVTGNNNAVNFGGQDNSAQSGGA